MLWRFGFYVLQCALLVLLLPAAGLAFLDAAETLGSRVVEFAVDRYFLLGALLFVPVALVGHRALRFWYVLAHELTHALGGAAFGGRPVALQATSGGGGAVELLGPRRLLWLVLLLPYVVNPSYLLVLALPWARFDLAHWAAALAGVGVAFGVVSNLLHIRPYQSDLRKAGWVRSLLFLAWGNLLVLGLLLEIVLGRGFGRVPPFLGRAFTLQPWQWLLG